MRCLTVRNLPDGLAKALQKAKRRRGASLNQTVIDLLAGALGVGPGAEYSNGLSKLAGSWTDEELAAFEQNTAWCERVDEELWS